MKKIVFCIIYSIIVLEFVTGCTGSQKAEDKVKKELNGLYSIESGEVVYGRYDSNPIRIREMDADGMKFFIYTAKGSNGTPMGETYIYTSILSSVYEKYQNQIKSIGSKYGVSVTYNFSSNEYKNKSYFNDCETCDGHFLTIKSNQINSVKNFVNEVLSIDEIKSLYDIWLNNDFYNEIVVDYSEIIIDGDNNYTSIFDFYKSN